MNYKGFISIMATFGFVAMTIMHTIGMSDVYYYYFILWFLFLMVLKDNDG